MAESLELLEEKESYFKVSGVGTSVEHDPIEEERNWEGRLST